jgi:hypothetical protein
MIVKELFGTQIINASFLFANSNISVKYYSKDFPSVDDQIFFLQIEDLVSITTLNFRVSAIRKYFLLAMGLFHKGIKV